ncbi:hypothetical protein EVAR_11145_1 [Eumeta japonica]|uniref:Uncharacterized protein n=1 Tax=Eumeta variegata TaxID=151549 RepID=A0A4C1U560_EUMVA|nr:hypothetical protein EVAR_11145_1 [Eumeta japonica]
MATIEDNTSAVWLTLLSIGIDERVICLQIRTSFGIDVNHALTPTPALRTSDIITIVVTAPIASATDGLVNAKKTVKNYLSLFASDSGARKVVDTWSLVLDLH